MHRLRACALLVVWGAGCAAPSGTAFHRFDGGHVVYDDLADPNVGWDGDVTPGDGGERTDLAGGGDGSSPVDLLQPPDLLPDPCVVALAALRYDFEADSGGFTHGAMDGYLGDSSWPFDEWERGAPSGPGPGTCWGGSSCYGTYLSGNYVSCERAELRSPTIDLSACAGRDLKLVYHHAYTFWNGGYGNDFWTDGGVVEISNDGGGSWGAPPALTSPGTIWINPDRGASYRCLSPNSFYVNGRPGYVGSSGGWHEVQVAIPASHVTNAFALRFAYGTGVSSSNSTPATSRPNARPGWYVDDVAIELQ